MKIIILKRGFTLVELMVVVSIIGILSSIVYANFADSKKIARDEIRKTTLKDLQLALNLYKAQNGKYPIGCKGSGSNNWSGTSLAGNTSLYCGVGSDYIQGLTPDFISALPYDTYFSNTLDTGYIYTSDGNDYKLMAYKAVEKTTVVQGNEFARCPILSASKCGGSTNNWEKTYAVYSPGAATW